MRTDDINIVGFKHRYTRNYPITRGNNTLIKTKASYVKLIGKHGRYIMELYKTIQTISDDIQVFEYYEATHKGLDRHVANTIEELKKLIDSKKSVIRKPILKKDQLSECIPIVETPYVDDTILEAGIELPIQRLNTPSPKVLLKPFYRIYARIKSGEFERSSELKRAFQKLIDIRNDNRLPSDLRNGKLWDLLSELHLSIPVLNEGFNEGSRRVSSYPEPDCITPNGEIIDLEDFSWGGLEGEEAYTAMWNCD